MAISLSAWPIPALQLLDLLADGAGFFLGIPGAGDGDFLAGHAVGAQGLAEPAFVMRDQMRGGGEDMAGGAVIALQADHLGAGEVVIEAQDVVDLGAAPAIDRLVVVADAADVFGSRLRRVILGTILGRALGNDGCGRDAPLRQQPQPEILRDVRILILVDQNELEAALILAEHVGVLAEQPDVFEQQVAEIGGVENLQALLKRLVEFQPLAVGEGGRLAGRHLLGREPAVLPAVDQHGEHARRPALVVDAFGGEQLLQQPDLVVDIENGEVGFEPDQFGMAAQDFHADRMEGAEPGHALDHAADDLADAVLHLARRLVGEGDGEDLAGPGAAGGEDMGDAHGEHAGLAGAGAGQHQDRAVERLDGFALLGIEAGEIRRTGSRIHACGGLRARGNAAARGLRRGFHGLDVAL